MMDNVQNCDSYIELRLWYISVRYFESIWRVLVMVHNTQNHSVSDNYFQIEIPGLFTTM
jgi:hypothetical protein